MKTKLLLSVLLPALIVAGCLMSGTFSIKVHLDNIATAFVSGVVSETVDLSEEEEWADHQDKIERIESVNFDAIITNVLTTTETLSVYVSAISTYASATAVLDAVVDGDAFPVLENYACPGSGTDTLTVTEAQALLQLSGANFTNVKNLLKTGGFTVYVTSTGTAFVGSIAEANIYVTFTASE